MKITTRSEYALRALFDMSKELQNASVIRIEDIANRQEIPPYYLEQILMKLRKAGIVAALKGPGGGYHLYKTLKEIKLGEVFKAVGDDPFGKPKSTKTATRASIKVDKILKLVDNSMTELLNKTLGEF